MSIAPGTRLGSYEVLARVGGGGMGEVYRAHDSRLNRDVALKVLSDELREDPQSRARFLREAESVAGLAHAHICVLHDIGQHEGTDFLVMEYLEGETLAARLERGALSIDETLRHGVAIADALSYAHDHGIVHRDLKPGNILLTGSGAKLLDFGLAKPQSTPAPGDTATHLQAMTAEGAILGTVPYMSPEQVKGHETDHRTDMFSFGVVLHEMLSGTHPFQRDSRAETISAILTEAPEARRPLPAGTDRRLRDLVGRLLAKTAAERPDSMHDVLNTLRACQGTVAHPSGTAPAWRTRPVALGLTAAIAIAIAFFGYQYVARVGMVRWATSEALPQARALAASGDLLGAFRLAQEAEAHISGDPILEVLLTEISRPLEVVTEPAGADLYYRDPLKPDAEWQHAGQTPLHLDRFPAQIVRWRIEKAGFQTVEALLALRQLSLTLQAAGEGPPDMIRVPEGNVGWTSLINLGGEPNKSVPLGEFFIGRHEVTNAQFKAFVDAGGYRDAKYWTHKFVKDGRTLSWAEGVALFVDPTGMPGPSTWRLGDFPEGQGQFPVGGVSWYEAAAYAEFSGAALPTVFHWTRAAGTAAADQIVPLSNLQGEGPEAVGSRDAIGMFGLQDVAGNVREWCLNAFADRRSILGGSWLDPPYMFGGFNDLQSPWDRSRTNGFRTAIYPGGLGADAGRDLVVAVRDFADERPVADNIFEVYRERFAYDRRDLNAQVEAVHDGPDRWIHERVTFDAAYPGDRVSADLYLPLQAAGPHQVVVYFPGSGAISPTATKDLGRVDFLIRSGRAVLYPSYKGTYDRADGETFTWPTETVRFRDDVIKWGQDLSRSIDYLETRQDIDRERIAYFGTSWGGRMGVIFPAVERRIRLVVLWLGGLAFGRARPEVDQINFATRVTQPVLMLNGKYDQLEPLQTAQLPLFRLLGSPEADKSHHTYETGHAIPRDEGIKETLAWLDKYFGPVRR